MRRVPISPNHPSNYRPQVGTPLESSGWRTLHLVDVDNLPGEPGCTEGDRIRSLFDAYRQVSSFGDATAIAVCARGCISFLPGAGCDTPHEMLQG